MNLSSIHLGGRISSDLELKYAGETPILNFSIAVNKKVKGEEKTSFIPVTAFGKTAENINKFFSKGREILVSGELVQESWQDKTTGDKRSKLSVTAFQFQFCGSSKTEGQQVQRNSTNAAPSFTPPNEKEPPVMPPMPSEMKDDDSEIPF